MAVDPGRLAVKLRELADELAAVRGPLDEVIDDAQRAQNVLTDAVSGANQQAAQALNRAVDAAHEIGEYRIGTHEGLSEQIGSAQGDAHSAADNAQAAASMVAHRRAMWEARLRRTDESLRAIEARIATAPGKRVAALEARRRELLRLRDCCRQAVADCRSASGDVAVAQQQAQAAGEAVRQAAQAHSNADDRLRAGEQSASSAHGLASQAQQAAMQAGDAAEFAQHALTESRTHSDVVLVGSRSGEDALLDASDRLRDLDGGL